MTTGRRNLLLLLIFFSVATGLYVADRIVKAGIARLATSIAEPFHEALERQDRAVARFSRTFEDIEPLTASQQQALRRYRNAAHVERARELGVEPLSSLDEARELAAEDELVPLGPSPYYYVQDLTHSVAYVTPDAARLLERIGERFHERLREEGLPLFRFCISSVLRTQETQSALRRVNPNAAAGVSSHEFGTTLDIVYDRYAYLPRPEDELEKTPYAVFNDDLEQLRIRAYRTLATTYRSRLKGILGRVLIELQREGDVLVVLERRQPVFHITVGRRLPETNAVASAAAAR